VHLKLVATLEQAIADIDATVGKALASVHTDRGDDGPPDKAAESGIRRPE
jgi:hypothetical protein